MIGTRPDFAFVIARLSRFMENPTNRLCVAVKRSFDTYKGENLRGEKYAKHTPTSKLDEFFNAHYNVCPINCKVTSGYVFTNSGGAISWKSKKQTLTAASTTEAGYVALAAVLQEVVWLRRVSMFAKSSSEASPVVIRIDNEAAMKLAKMMRRKVGLNT